ncbi:MAG: DUF4112 domain-containing protein [Gemmatimonadota bacterium]
MSVFVGRAQELQRLKGRFSAAVEGRGSVVFITGEAGAGKSTLIEQFLQEATAATPAPKIVDSICSEQFGAGEPYQPFIEAFSELLREGGRSGGKATLAQMAKEIAPAWLGLVPVVGDIMKAGVSTAKTIKDQKKEGDGGKATFMQVAKEVAPDWIGAIPVVGNVLEASLVTARTIKEARSAPMAASEEALFFQYTELLHTAAAEQPVILFIDDLHWADRASVTLLHHLGRRIEESRVLILGTYRPVDVDASDHPIKKVRQELERYGVAEELRLTALDPDSLGELLEKKLGAPASPPLREWLVRRAGSNPLFFGTLVDWLVDQGYAHEREGEWDLVQHPEEVEIPRSAEAALERRLERLDPEVYRVLEYASAEGDEFHSVILAKLLDMDELELEESLKPIERVHQLIRLTETRDFPSGEVSSVYLFGHSLVQDILHGKLKGKRRILLHRKIAETLLELYGSETSEVDNKLAVHYDEGRQPERAFECAVLAADRASDMYAHLDASELLRLALRNSQTDEKRVKVLDRLGTQHQLIGKFPEALNYFGEALRLTEDAGDRTQAVSLRRKIIGVDLEYGHRPAGELLGDLKQVVREASELGADTEVCHALFTFRNMPEAVRAAKGTHLALLKALQIAERLEDKRLIKEARYHLGSLLVFGEDPAQGIDHLTTSLELAEELGDRERVGLCHNVLGIGYVLVGRYEQAVEELNAAAATFREIGDPVSMNSVKNNLGTLLSRMGDFEGAEENLEEALRITRRLDSAKFMLHVLLNLAELAEARGDRERALEYWRALREKALEVGYTEDAVTADCGLGIGRLEEGDLGAARAAFESAEKGLGDAGEWTESHEAFHRLGARLAAAEGDAEGALRHVESAEEALRSRDRYEWACFRLLRGELLTASDAARSSEAIREALAVFEELGTEPMRRRAESLLTAPVT